MWLMRIYCNVYVLLLEYVMLRMGNGIVILDLLLYMEGICASMIDGIELREWLYDMVMYCERGGW